MTLGAAVSELALAGLDREDGGGGMDPTTRNGVVLLPTVPDHVLSNEMVPDALAEG